MLIEVALGAVTFAQMWKASDLNEKALATLRDAHNTHADAVYLVQSHKEAADQKLRKLVNRKKAILTTRMSQFLSVYQEIKKIDFRPGDGIVELYSNMLTVQQVEELKIMATTALKPLSDKEMAAAYIFTGVGGSVLRMPSAMLSLQIIRRELRIPCINRRKHW